MKESFVLYKAFYEPVKDLSDEELGQLFRIIFDYQITGQIALAKVSPPVRMAFEFFKNQFRLDDIKYQKTVEANRSNGLKGGRPKKPKLTEDDPNNPMGYSEPKKADKEKENVNDKEKDLVITGETPEVLDSMTSKYRSLVDFINKHLNKHYRYRDKKALDQFKARLRDGYTAQDFQKAIINAMSIKRHIETNYQYITPEFVTRSTKLEMLLNTSETTPEKGKVGII
jgi:uncharacterized phage protein (TIGR02220 family)